MKPRTIALVAAVVAMAGALVLLIIRVQATPDYALAPEVRAEAETLHDKAERAPAPRAANTPRSPGRSPKIPRPAARPAPRARGAGSPTVAGPGGPTAALRTEAGARAAAGSGMVLREKMAEARRMYDDKLYPESRTLALEVLETSPKNIRMLRIVVSASCLMGEVQPARQYVVDLPLRDQLQMRKKCAKYGTPLHETGD